MKKPILVIISAITALSTPFVSEAGDKDIEWESLTYDFGTISEEDGPRQGEFRFVNKGAPVTILRVKTSCGCTTAEYDHREIANGDTALIKFAYDPTRRPGRFEKSMKVYLGESGDAGDGTPEAETLYIKGLVKASAQTIEQDYPVDLGSGVRLSGRMVNLGDILQGASRHGFLQMYNSGEEPVELHYEPDNVALTAKSMPDSINPGENGIISFCLDTAKEHRVGELVYQVKVENLNAGDSSMILKVWANIEQDKSVEVKKGKGKYGKVYTKVKKEKTPAEKEASKVNKAFSSKYMEVKKKGKR